ncbi:LacI family DNA-binding transcriptional regulator [Actinoplanes sp. NPDC051859]|uniref:LacI family DNA-binding transcriptional regulator n=1 Tax=Actinoplanes sp. NPDC051859 TaxID=3363909 RepID=UPI0037A75F28
MVTRERPTLEAVARRAGVSRATVSRVVNGSTTVAAAIRDAVVRAVEELGYVPNQAARSLVTQRTESIALILPESASRVFSDDLFFPAVIRGVSLELEAADKQLVLMMAGSAAGQERVQRYATAGHVDGVMFASMHGTDPLPGRLARLGIPVVCSGRPMSPAHPAIPYVDVDHIGGVMAAVRHLLDLGRRRIATIAGPQDMVAGIDRLTGYRTALRDAGLPEHVAYGDFTRESGIQAMRRLLADDPALDAVFVASDMMAHGALQALRETGRRIPADVAVIGFDDFEISRLSDPPLTTVHQPIVDMGRTMAGQILGLVTATADVPAAVVLPTKLVVRASA